MPIKEQVILLELQLLNFCVRKEYSEVHIPFVPEIFIFAGSITKISSASTSVTTKPPGVTASTITYTRKEYSEVHIPFAWVIFIVAGSTTKISSSS